MARKRRGQRAKSEMNVVPYIDVMLVLLVIFMISAPLLNQSVEVDLPQSSNSKEIQPQTNDEGEPELKLLVISVDSKGNYFVEQGDNGNEPTNAENVARITKETLTQKPDTEVYIRADKSVNYGAVMVVMDLLKSNGAKAVGLITAQEE